MPDDTAPPPPLVHEEDVPWERFAHGDAFAFRRRKLGGAAGGERLGCSLVEVAPGKRSWPFHYHCANEEAIYVLSGRGRARVGRRELPVRAGSYLALRCRPDEAHQMINDGDAPLRYLCFSTMVAPDVAVYPDSGKVGIFCGSAPGGDKGARHLQAFLPLAAAVGYWEGEEG